MVILSPGLNVLINLLTKIKADHR